MSYQLKFETGSIADKISGLTEIEALSFLANAFEERIVFNSSFGWEDQVITHLILSNNIGVEIFTIDSGRLFDETYKVWNSTNKQYNANIKAYYPLQENVEDYVSNNGPNAFYESKELRNQCCFIRKTEPLQRALAGNTILVTALRKEHLPEGREIVPVEWDELNQVIVYHPLLYWTTDEVKNFIYRHNIPYHPLHNKGFVRIGCAPCTRAIKPGEDVRSANWWWETKKAREYSLSTASF